MGTWDTTARLDRRQQASEIIHWRIYEVVFHMKISAICFHSFSFCHSYLQITTAPYNTRHRFSDSGLRHTFNLTKESVLFGKYQMQWTKKYFPFIF